MKAVYKGVRDSCTSALSGAKDKYYQDVVGGAEGNVKQLYKVTSTLLGRSTENQLPSRTDDTTLANDFLHCFADKIANLRDTLGKISVRHDSPNIQSSDSRLPHATFSDFRPISENEVSKLIMTSKSTTCELDVIPTKKNER